ncbi:hypothetical protein BCAR13_860031 [Paraburkholderia caribensis]|nr:hypothetical protein BCAR13_860031 [Paraburkholderia caribensis]
MSCTFTDATAVEGAGFACSVLCVTATLGVGAGFIGAGAAGAGTGAGATGCCATAALFVIARGGVDWPMLPSVI